MLAFQVHLTISGSLRCGDKDRPVAVALQQNLSWSVDCCTELANGTIKLKSDGLARPSKVIERSIEGQMRLDKVGGILVSNSSAWAWWYGSEQLVIRSDLLQAFQQGAVDALCGAANVQAAAAARVADLQLALGAGGPGLFTRTRSDPQTAASAMYAARRLAGEPESPVVVDTTHCSMQCPVGALTARAPADEPYCPAQPQIQGQKRAVLDALSLTSSVDRCLLWLHQDYASCGNRKVAADLRFAACFREADSGASCPIPSGSIDLPSWWRGCLARARIYDASSTSLGLLDDATAELAATFD